MVQVETRCTQCGESATRDIHDPKHGGGREHGTEVTHCGDCGEETLQNRCGQSVIRNDRGR